MLLDSLQADLNTSLKAGNATRVGTLRFLIAAIFNSAIAKYGSTADKSLTDLDVVDVVKKQIKTHKESIEIFEKAGRKELAAKEKSELAVLEEFAPKEMSDEELRALLRPIVSSGEQDFGLIMKQAMASVSGRADGGRVAALIKQLMSSK